MGKLKMREAKAQNKYNLTISKIKNLKVGDRNKICRPLFWRNEVIKAWCLSEEVGSELDIKFAANNEYWIGIYDEDAKSYAGKFRFSLSSYGGMCGYNFEKFFQPEDIDGELDLQVQERFLNKINMLIDEGILVIPCNNK